MYGAGTSGFGKDAYCHRTYPLSDRGGRAEVRPDQILVITFTRYAAREMKERFERLTAGKKLSGNVWDLSQYFPSDSQNVPIEDWSESYFDV